MNLMGKPRISDCGTYHINSSGLPLYTSRFSEVLSFHQVDNCLIAPVQKDHLSFHIDINGKPIYEKCFTRCFGFYCGVAAVIDGDEWYHIRPNGTALYEQRYKFAGNYQKNIVVVADENNYYFHIDIFGKPLYKPRWTYCGDFRDGIAVVQSSDGLSTHIRTDGSLLHKNWFTDLDVYHKAFARAKTNDGWCHINKIGDPIYDSRFASVEPFYNGVARCETHEGCVLLINERGENVRCLRDHTKDEFAELSADMVGYWKTFTIATAVRLGIFENLPASLPRLAMSCGCQKENLIRLLKALAELNLVSLQDDVFKETVKGGYLRSNHLKSLSEAAKEYAGDLLLRWERLPGLIRGESVPSDIFSSISTDSKRVSSHHRMLASYALHDYIDSVYLLPISKGKTVLDAGGGTGTLAKLIQKQFPGAKIILGDLKSVIDESDFINKIELDLFKQWPIKIDNIVMSRVLHDWSDNDAIKILINARKALLQKGKILILERLLDKKSFSGALCDLHLLTVTGGKERNKENFESLAQKVSLQVEKIVKLPSLVSLIVLKKAE